MVTPTRRLIGLKGCGSTANALRLPTDHCMSSMRTLCLPILSIPILHVLSPPLIFTCRLTLSTQTDRIRVITAATAAIADKEIPNSCILSPCPAPPTADKAHYVTSPGAKTRVVAGRSVFRPFELENAPPDPRKTPKSRLCGGRAGVFQVRFCRPGGMNAPMPATPGSAAAADPRRRRPARSGRSWEMWAEAPTASVTAASPGRRMYRTGLHPAQAGFPPASCARSRRRHPSGRI